MYRIGLGAPSDYSSYMAACTGPNGGSAHCDPMDQACVAAANAVVDACNGLYLSDPNSPHNSANPTSTPTLITASPAELQQGDWAAQQSGGTFQFAPAPSQPPTVTFASAPPATPKAAAVTSASSVPASQASTPAYSAGAPPAETSSTSTPGFTIPWWGWALAAGFGVFALRK